MVVESVGHDELPPVSAADVGAALEGLAGQPEVRNSNSILFIFEMRERIVK